MDERPKSQQEAGKRRRQGAELLSISSTMRKGHLQSRDADDGQDRDSLSISSAENSQATSSTAEEEQTQSPAASDRHNGAFSSISFIGRNQGTRAQLPVYSEHLNMHYKQGTGLSERYPRLSSLAPLLPLPPPHNSNSLSTGGLLGNVVAAESAPLQPYGYGTSLHQYYTTPHDLPLAQMSGTTRFQLATNALESSGNSSERLRHRVEGGVSWSSAYEKQPVPRKKKQRTGKLGKQSARWNDMFDRLLEFKRLHGHCLVPNRYANDPSLGAWVSTQRRHYKMLKSGEKNVSSPMTPERASRLASIGFAWATSDPRHVPWETRFKELLEFKREHGTLARTDFCRHFHRAMYCRVPSCSHS